MYILHAEVHLEQEEEYKNYMRITPECFDELFVLMKDKINYKINYNYGRCKHTKTNACCKYILSLLIYSLIFLIIAVYFIKFIWVNKFDQTNLTMY